MSSLIPFEDAIAKLQAANLGGVPLNLPNENFDVPEPPDIWCKVEMTGTILEAIELGNAGAWQEEGTLYVHVFSPTGTGTFAARGLAKTLVNIFRGLGPAPMVYLGASIGEGLAEDENGSWWRLTVSIDWRYQDV